jgi:hypothetical protein
LAAASLDLAHLSGAVAAAAAQRVLAAEHGAFRSGPALN